MARDEAPPFARGETYYNGETIDTTNLGGPNLEGREYRFEVNAPDGYTQADPSGRAVIVRVVRNVSAIALKPTRLVKFKAMDPSETQVDGYVSTLATDQIAGVVDEFLPAAGVPINDLFYIVVDGPTQCLLKLSGAADVVPGDRIAAIAGTSTTNNDAGRVDKYTGTTSAADSLTRVGRSESTQTGDDVAIKACVHFGPIR